MERFLTLFASTSGEELLVAAGRAAPRKLDKGVRRRL
jgi:hypothetical protein